MEEIHTKYKVDIEIDIETLKHKSNNMKISET